MSLYRRALDVIEENKLKEFNCIPFDKKLPRTSEVIPGIQQGRYYIVSGASGAGKSQLTDDLFVFTPFDFVNENKKIQAKILYFSLELGGVPKMHQWMAKRLYEYYGIRTSVDILCSVGKNRINDNIHMAVKEIEPYFNDLEKVLKLYEGSYTATNIITEVEDYVNENGKLDNKGNYVANNPNEYVLVIIDHLSLLTEEKGLSKKACMEKLSNFLFAARNKYKLTPVVIQQQSADTENLEHFKASKLEPSKAGLAESKLTYNDCDIAFGIFQPQKHEIQNYRGYDVLQMGDGYRNFSVFKNRYGTAANINVGLYFDGAVNYFKELPKKDSINVNHYDMIKKRNPHW